MKSLKEMLVEGPVRAVFVKKNGDEREMFCTLNSDLLPEKKEGTDRKPNPDVTVAYDLVADGFRSMLNDNIISYEMADGNDPRFIKAYEEFANKE